MHATSRGHLTVTGGNKHCAGVGIIGDRGQLHRATASPATSTDNTHIASAGSTISSIASFHSDISPTTSATSTSMNVDATSASYLTVSSADLHIAAVCCSSGASSYHNSTRASVLSAVEDFRPGRRAETNTSAFRGGVLRGSKSLRVRLDRSDHVKYHGGLVHLMEVLNSEIFVRKSVLRDGSHVFREHFCQLLSNDTSDAHISNVLSDLQPVLAVPIAAHRNLIDLS